MDMYSLYNFLRAIITGVDRLIKRLEIILQIIKAFRDVFNELLQICSDVFQ